MRTQTHTHAANPNLNSLNPNNFDSNGMAARLFNPCAIDAASKYATRPPMRLIVRRIGDAPEVLAAIECAFARVVECRGARLGDDAYAATLSAFKRDFGMAPTESWDALCDWPVSRGSQVLHYLNGRYAEATGRTV